MLIRVVNPKGMAPSLNAAVLADNMAQRAQNCVLGLGVVAPLRAPVVAAQPSKVGTVKSIFPYGGKWFNWLTPVSVCRSPIAQDAWGRVYFAGGAAFAPQMSVNTIATGGADYPAASYNLGIPAPLTAPAPSVQGTITDADPTLVDSRVYVECLVSAYGEEGPPGVVSVPVDVAPGQSVALSGLSTGAAGAYNLTHRRIYRTNTGTAGTDFQLVRPSAYPGGLIPLAVTAVTDDCPNDGLGSVLASADWDMPPADLHSLIMLPCGALAGLSKNQLCFSEPYLPHAWPQRYRLAFDFDGVALGAYGNHVLVATKGVPYVVSGSHPANMVPDRLEEGYACVAARGLVDMGYALIYPAADGLMLAGMGEIRLLTKDLINQRDWAQMAPESIHAYLWDRKYVAFWNNASGTGGFVYDPQTGDFAYHTVQATAGYHDPLTGVLYLVTAQGIVAWHAGDALDAAWKSKRFVLPQPVNFSCAQVQAKGYPVAFKLWADGVLKHERTVTGPAPFRLPGGFLPDAYEFEVSGTHEWMMVAMATSMQELAAV